MGLVEVQHASDRSIIYTHSDCPIYDIEAKGTAISQCEHCPELKRTKQHAKCGCDIKTSSQSRSRNSMHNATEGYIIGSRPSDQRHAVHYPSYPINANRSAYSRSPSSAAAASTSPCCPAPLGLDNPFATGSDISAPSSPLSVDFDHPSCLSPPKSNNPFYDSEISAPPSPASVDFDRSCYFGGLGLDNPFATGSEVSVPSSPFSVNSDIPEDAATAEKI